MRRPSLWKSGKSLTSVLTRPRKNQPIRRRGLSSRGVELLEERRLLAADLYVNDTWLLEPGGDLDSSGDITVGDIVESDTGAGDAAISGLIYGTDAFSSINAALAAASPGDTINVLHGNYTGAFTVSMGTALEPISIKAFGSGADVNLNAASPTGITISAGAHAVIEGISLSNFSTNGVLVEGNLQLSQSDILGGFVGVTVNGGTLDMSSTIVQNSQVFGMAVSSGSAVVDLSEFVGNGITTAAGVSIGGGSVNVTNSVLTNNVRGLLAVSSATATISGSNLDGNSLVAIENGSLNTVNASNNWWGSNDEATVFGETTGAVDFSPYLHNGTDLDPGNVGFVPDLSHLRVTTLGVQTGSVGRIQEGLNTVAPAGLVQVNAGTFTELVNFSGKSGLTLQGAGSDPLTGTTIVGPHTSPSNSGTVTLGNSSNNVIDGFVVTRNGNNLANWDSNGMVFGVWFNEGSVNNTLQNSLIIDNRTAVDIRGTTTTGNIIQDNDIIENRTGVIVWDGVFNNTFQQNRIADNHTVGVLYLDETTPAVGNVFHNNDISGNWYSQVEDRRLTGVTRDMSGNWFGTTDITVTLSNAGEPGYSALIPTKYGGPATAPPTSLVLSGGGAYKIDYTPWLDSGANSKPLGETGFEGDFSTLHVSADSPQAGATGRITEAIGLLPAGGGTLLIYSGTYNEDVDTTGKPVTLEPGASPGQVTINGDLMLDTDDVLVIEIDGAAPGTGYDQLVVTGSVTLGGASLQASLGYFPFPGTSFTIVDNAGSDPVAGQFAGLGEGDTITLNDIVFTISYVGGDGNDVTLSMDQPTIVFVNDAWTGSTLGDDVDGPLGGALGNGSMFGFDQFATIADALAAVAPGGEIRIYDGDYTTSTLVIDKHVQIQGQSQTGVIVTAANNNEDIFRIVTSGTAGDPILLSKLTLTSPTSTNSGVQYGGITLLASAAPGNTIEHVTIEYVTATELAGRFKGTGVWLAGNNASTNQISSVAIIGSNLSDNGGFGVYSKNTRIDGLTIADDGLGTRTTIARNDHSGVLIEGVWTSVLDQYDNFEFRGIDFSQNNLSADLDMGHADLYLNFFNGDLKIEDVTVESGVVGSGTAYYAAVAIEGKNISGTQAAGNIVIDGIAFTDAPGATLFPRASLAIWSYANADAGISINDAEFLATGVTHGGLYFWNIDGSTPIQLSNATFDGNYSHPASPTHSAADITLLGGSLANVIATDNVTFVGAADGFDIENRIVHAMDHVSLTGATGRVIYEADTVYVTPQTQGIQRGVNVVGNNETVRVSADTYLEDLLIDKTGVQVVGQGSGLTVIDYTGKAGHLNAGVALAADNVELRGVTVTRTPSVALPNYGIKADGFGTTGNGDGTGWDGLVIEDVIVSNSRSTGLDLNGVTNTIVRDVVSQDNGGAGIFLTDVKGMLLENITTSNNPWTGISISSFGRYFPIGVEGVVFAGTNSFGESASDNGGLQIELGDFFDPANPYPISWSTDPGDAADVTILAADFGYALSGPRMNPTAKQYTRFYNTLGQAEDAAAGAPSHIDNFDRYIRETDPDNPAGTPGVIDFYVFDNAGDTMSIQAAIDAAAGNGDVINIASGVYLGDVDATAIGKSVYLVVGMSPGLVTIDGDLLLDSGDVLEIEIDGPAPGTGYDQLIVTGTVALGGATLETSRSFNPFPGDSFTIIDNQGSDPVSGTFDALSEGAVVTIDGIPFTISYVGGDGNDVTLTVAQPNVVFVDAAWAGSTVGDDVDGAGQFVVNWGIFADGLAFGYDQFATIQEAIDAVAVGGTVYVYAGEYVEELLIDKSVSLYGAQASVDARGRTLDPAEETILFPVQSGPDPFASPYPRLMYLTASGVTIDGFLLDGDNPNLISGFELNGADIDAQEAISSYEGVGSITVENNIIRNFSYSGIQFYNYYNSGGATTDNYIRQNHIDNLGLFNWGLGVLIYNNFYAEITDNLITDVRVGIQTGNFHQANPNALFDPTIAGNEISATRTGVFYNLHYSNASPFTVTGNVITAVDDPDAPSTAKWAGMLIASQQGTVDATIAGNTIDGSGTNLLSAGYNVWNTPTTADLTISGGSVGGVDYGVWVNNFEGYNENANNTQITIDGIDIAARDIGVYVLDSPSNTNGALVTATITGSTQITTSDVEGVGIQVVGANANATIDGASVSGNDIGIEFVDGAAGSVSNVDFSGTANVTDLRIAANAGTVAIGDGNTFGGSTFFIENLSTQSYDLSGYVATVYGPFDPMLLTDDNFRIEDQMHHAMDDESLGLIRWVADQLFVTDGGTDHSIQRGINIATPGDTIHVEAGTYSENIVVNKQLQIVGAGSLLTTLTAGSGHLIAVTVDDVSISGLTADGQGTATSGVHINSAIAGLTLADVAATGTNAGLRLAAGADVTGMLLDEVRLNANVHGLWVATTAKVAGDGTIGAGLTVLDSEFNDNDYGWLVAATGVDSHERFTDILVDGASFNDNASKGLYAEKLNNALLTNIEVIGSGYDEDSLTTPSGINLNLKFANFANITIEDAVLEDNGLGRLPPLFPGHGIAIEADQLYSGSLTGLTLTNVSVSGSPIGLIVGGNLHDISMSGVALSGQGLGLAILDPTGLGEDLDLGDTSFVSVGDPADVGGFILNVSQFNVDARGATFTKTGGAVVFADFNPETGDTATDLDIYYAIADYVVDKIDEPLGGLVMLKSGHLFVSNNDERPLVLDTFAPDTSVIQGAVLGAQNGDVIHIQSGAYDGDVDATGKDLVFSLGSSPGQVTINGDLTLDAGDTLVIEVNGLTPGSEHDQLVVNGTVELGGAQIDLTSGSIVATPGDSITIIDNDDVDAISGIFDGLPNGSTVEINGQPFVIFYDGGDGNDVVLTRVTSLTAPTQVFVDAAWSGSTVGDDVDGAGNTVTNWGLPGDLANGSAFGYDQFATIQEAINAVAVGGTVYVYAGTYDESVSVGKSVTLLGANASYDPNNDPRVAESVLHPASWYGIYVTGSDVTIDGFTIDGEGTADYGIYAYTTTGAGSHLVQNNIIEDFVQFGFVGWVQSGPASSNNLVTRNTFDNVAGRSIVALWNYYTNATHNVISNTAVGIYAENANSPEASGNVEWSNNEISATRSGIWYNLAYGTATPLTIVDNEIVAEDHASTARFSGMWITSIGANLDPVISGNNITVSSITQPQTVGYDLWNDTTTAGITLSGGTVDGADYGVWVNNFDGYPTTTGSDGGSTTVNVDGVQILNSALAGVYVKDNPLNTISATVHANILAGTEISGGGHGVLVEGADASATIDGASVSGNSIGIEFVDGGAGSVSNVDFSGTANGTDLRIAANAGIVAIGDGNEFGGSTFFIENLSTQSYDLSGYVATVYGPFDPMLLTDNFRIEDQMHHAMDDESLGLIRWVADELFVTDGGTDHSIQRGINIATPGDTIHVEAGNYSENIVVNKFVRLLGAGSGETIIDGGNNRIFDLQAGGASASQRLVIDGMSLTNGGFGAIYTNAVLSHVDLTDLEITASDYAITVHNNAQIGDLVLDNVVATGNTVGFRVATSGKVDGLHIQNSQFDDNQFGMYVAAVGSSTTNETDFTNILIEDSTFSDNTAKGIYIEKLNDAMFTNVTVDNSGTVGAFAAGVDINLKYGTFENIAFNNLTVTNSGTGDAINGVGLAIKARDDAPSYSGNPATLDTVEILGGTFADNQAGILFGEPGKLNSTPTNATVSGVSFADQVGADINVAGGVVQIGNNASYTVGGTAVLVTGGTAVVDGATIDTTGGVAVDVVSGSATITNSDLLGNLTGIRVAGGTASISSNDFSTGTSNNVDVDVAGGTALVQANVFAGQIGLLVRDGGTVDAGQVGAPSPSNFTGLGISSGGNDFTAYLTAASATNGAIVNLNSGAPYDAAGPQGTPFDVTAFGNVFDGSLNTTALIDSVIWHDPDDTDVGFVDFAAFENLSILVDLSLIDEGDTVELTISFSNDPQAHELIVDWGDGNQSIVALAPGVFGDVITHTYLDDLPSGVSGAIYTISVTVEELSTSTILGPETTLVTVNNVAPDVTITGAPLTSPEGTPINLGSIVVDPGILDTFTYYWEVEKVGFGIFATGALDDFTFTPDDDGTYIVTLTVEDDDLSIGFDTVTIDVFDVSPTIALSGLSTINEGSLYTLNLGAVTDPGDDTVTSYIVYWGDGSVDVYATPGNKTHYYDDNALVTDDIRVDLVDENGLHPFAGTLSLTVNNVAPTAILIAGTPVVNEGSNGSVFFAGQADVSANDTAAGFRYAYDFDNNGIFEVGDGTYAGSVVSASAIVPASFLANGPGSRTVRARIIDKDGGFNDYTTVITINNVAPVVAPIPNQTAFAGIPFEYTVNFTDPGADAPWAVDIDWDRIPPAPVVFDQSFTTGTHSFLISNTYDVSDIGSTYTVRVQVGDGHAIGFQDFQVTVVEDTFRVVDFQTNASGFDVTFNRSPFLDVLNIYDGLDPSIDLPDLTLVGSTVGNVRGSMVWDEATYTLSFVKTGGVLSADTYTVTLVSSSDAFQDEFLSLLDGNSDYIPGGNYTNMFVVAPSSARVVGIRDFARGPGQVVDDTPASPGSQLAVRIDNASGVTALDFDVHYNPDLLTINGASLAPGLPPGWSITVNPVTPGLLKVTASGIAPLTGTNVPVVLLDAEVPDDAPYGDSQVIRFSGVRVNEDLIASKADYAIHKNVYLGDADGNGIYSGFDSSLISRVVVGLDSGFDAHDWTDPLIVGDTTGDGTLSGLDASYLAQKAIFAPRPEIPDLPGIVLIPGTPGIDPELSIPTDIPATAGGSVVVPVNIDIDPGADVYSATFKVLYDPAVLEYDSVANGAFWPAAGNWSLLANDIAPGELYVVMFNQNPSVVDAGTIVDITFNVQGTAPEGSSALTIDKVDPTEGGLSWTDVAGSVLVSTVPSDTDPPQVTSVLMGSTAWSTSFKNYLTANSLGNADGYAVPFGSSQLQTLPWTNLNTVSLVFSEDVIIDVDDLAIVGISSSYTVSSFNYNSSTFTATWTLDAPISNDKLLLYLFDTVTDLAGNELDGEWTNSVSTGPSGNGTAGGDFSFRVNVLPGDVDGNNIVLANDATIAFSSVPSTTMSPSYNVRADVNGDGFILAGDSTAVFARVPSVLPPGEPTPPAAAGLPSSAGAEAAAAGLPGLSTSGESAVAYSFYATGESLVASQAVDTGAQTAAASALPGNAEARDDYFNILAPADPDELADTDLVDGDSYGQQYDETSLIDSLMDEEELEELLQDAWK